MESTYKLAVELKNISQNYNVNFRTSVFQFRPYHGTAIYNSLKEKYPGLSIDKLKHNRKLSSLIGRKQFNFNSNNFSKVSLKIIRDYICKTNMI